MSLGTTVTVACQAAPAARRQWFGELARLLASTPAPAAALLESSSDRPLVRVTVRPAELVDVLARSPAGSGTRTAPLPSRAPAAPIGLDEGRAGYLLRSGRGPATGAAAAGVTVDRVGVAPTLSPGDWVGLQTFWIPARRGTLWMLRRFRLGTRSPDTDSRFRAVGSALAAAWSLAVGTPATYGAAPYLGFRRDWRRGCLRTAPPAAWFETSPRIAARVAPFPDDSGPEENEAPVETPALVFGASGAGKTTYLARWAAGVVDRGESLIAIDLHGDLTPAIVSRLSATARGRVVAVDAARPPVAGIGALVAEAPTDRAAAHLVAALKRLSPDGADIYWGFRLERIFDTVIRLALESGGSLADVYDLLTSADRRDAARLATRSGELARFLDELGPVVRRNPEFLWSAATRLSKVMLVPALRQLLAPEDGGLPVERLIEERRSLLVRLPFSHLGPEAAGFAGTLVLGRVYFGLLDDGRPPGGRSPVSLVLDEVQAFSPRLVSEILTEGRKFGVRAIVATQYPERLARELVGAARGALRGFVSFRVPRPSAVEAGSWLGLGAADAAELLPSLPTGHGLALDTRLERVRPTRPEPAGARSDGDAWAAAVETTRCEFAVASAPSVGDEVDEGATERLLLAVLSAGERGATVAREEAVAASCALPGISPDRALLAHRLPVLEREGFLVDDDRGLHLTPAGERRLGLTVATGAARESAEHRALLLATLRRFAARGYALEIVRQGRFDTSLPDARFRQLSGRGRSSVPAELAFEVDRWRTAWAWRFFHGRDVYVEAEVSGALRPERIRHGARKALRQGAFVLFVVGDAHRARRVRSVLRTMGLGVDRAQVWTLRLTLGAADRGPPTNG